MPYANFDRSQYPLIVVTFTGEKANNQNFDEYLNQLSENYNGKESVKILFDASNAVFPGLKFQQLQSKWLKENEELMRRECLGIAYVIPSSIIRNALNLILSIQSQPTPFEVFKRVEKANNWLKTL